jgi:hypothetical protein
MVAVGPDPMKVDVGRAEIEFPSSYRVILSSQLNDCVSVPMESTFATIEPHGAIILSRFVSGEEAQVFELSGAEFETLLKTYRRRKRLLKRAAAVALADLDSFPF